ncbi:hypothetical protein E4U45_004839 [Claviceps purpurea]|nr:hypothetical protein E4U45_004839 [Claviceps purpurea]
MTGTDYDEARGDFFGPFVDEDEFNGLLRCGAPRSAHYRMRYTEADARHQIVPRTGILTCEIS